MSSSAFPKVALLSVGRFLVFELAAVAYAAIGATMVAGFSAGWVYAGFATGAGILAGAVAGPILFLLTWGCPRHPSLELAAVAGTLAGLLWHFSLKNEEPILSAFPCVAVGALVAVLGAHVQRIRQQRVS